MELTNTPTISTAGHDVDPHSGTVPPAAVTEPAPTGPSVTAPPAATRPPAIGSAPAVDTEPPAAAPHPDPAATAPARFTLHRSRTDRMLGGVCGGLAESLEVDAMLLRIILVALTVVGFGLGVVFYLAAWILAPEN